MSQNGTCSFKVSFCAIDENETSTTKDQRQHQRFCLDKKDKANSNTNASIKKAFNVLGPPRSLSKSLSLYYHRHPKPTRKKKKKKETPN